MAHEIQNPLNFVKNFAEVSEELLEELQEVLEEEGTQINDEQRELLNEIKGDLTDNLGRIRHHGDRANRIVRDMLQMGRGFRRGAGRGYQRPARRTRSPRFPQRPSD